MAQVIEEETIHLHDEDGISMKLWMDRLEQENTCVFLKDKISDPPSWLKSGHRHLCDVYPNSLSSRYVLAPWQWVHWDQCNS